MMAESVRPALGVLGAGYVGLPLAIEAARSGIRVVVFDVAPEVVAGLNDGHSHIPDIPSEKVERARDRTLLRATTDPRDLAGCEAMAICVPTPLSKSGDPDVSHVLDAARMVASVLVPGCLVVLESTIYPGGTRDLVLPVLSQNGLCAGRDFHLCFSPERVDPANERWGIRNTAKLIGGVTPDCTRAGMEFYSRFVEHIVPVSSSETAEFAKILENAFRAVNIGFANEMAQVADKLGLDIWEVLEAAGTKPFGFMKFQPGPGPGGHCIPVDPQYLAWKMRSLGDPTRLIELAAEINAEMPAFVVGKVREALAPSGALKGSRVLLVGVAFKRDVPDVRGSPALAVLDLLEREGADVIYHDPHVPEWNTGDRVLRSVPLLRSVLGEADAVVVVADHASIDYGRIRQLSRALVDARNATRRVAAPAGEPGGPWIVKKAKAGSRRAGVALHGLRPRVDRVAV